MCTLTFCLPGETPDEAELAESCRMNKDGYGFGIIGDGKLIVVKNMDAKKAMRAFYRMRRKYINSPAIFHARIGTHGEHGLVNCHPFYVNREHTVMLAHNGVLPVSTFKNDGRSDTAVFAEEYMRRLLPLIDEPHIADMVTKFIGYNNKFVLLSIDPVLKHDWYIFNEDKGGGHWQDKKIWWSNRSYTLPRQFTTTQSAATGPVTYGERTWIDKVEGTTTYGHYEYRGNDDHHRGEVWVLGKGWLKWADATEDERKVFIDAEQKKKAAKDAHIKTDKDTGQDKGTTASKQSTVRIYRKDNTGHYRWYEGIDEVEEEKLNEDLAAELQEIEDSDSKLTGVDCDVCGQLLTVLGENQGCCTSCWCCQECHKDIEECTCIEDEQEEVEEVTVSSMVKKWETSWWNEFD